MMEIEISRSSAMPIYQQIARSIGEKIKSEELVEGEKLPSERRLAEELGVHRNTVIKAYAELVSEGLIVASHVKPKGYFVKSLDAIKFRKRFFSFTKAFRYELRTAEKKFNDVYWKSEEEKSISFAGIIMPKSLDPVIGMEKVTERIFDRSEYGNMLGFYRESMRLKENIRKLLKKEGINASVRNIQLLAETNQAISYLLNMYVREGDYIIAESPMVPDIYSIFYNRGIKVICIPMQDDGMCMDLLEKAVRKFKPKFIYTLPNYHNPTGITMSLKKRKHILAIANEYNVPIIEDDYQRDFCYDGNPLPSLYELDANHFVIYVNSFTLTFPYMMKSAYVVGPEELVDMLGYAISVDETAVGGVGQYFLNEYIESGGLERHIGIIRDTYRDKCELLCSELDRLKDLGLTYIKPDGGVILWLTLPPLVDEKSFCEELEKRGVLIMQGSYFYSHPKSKGGHFRMCFSNVTDEEIVTAVKIIEEILIGGEK